jgi:hypothetical protein|tara:strand:- start:747 stop:977 length:231 start_codon:yes stop_codon:yes gene_type:complete
MLNIVKFIKSKTGMDLLSILLGFGLSAMFKMSCDSRDCLVYEAGNMDVDIIKYGDDCFKATQKPEICDKTKKQIQI